LAYRDFDDALGLSTMAGENLADARTGKNGRHALVGLLRQSVFSRLAGYEDVNDAEQSTLVNSGFVVYRPLCSIRSFGSRAEAKKHGKFSDVFPARPGAVPSAAGRGAVAWRDCAIISDDLLHRPHFGRSRNRSHNNRTWFFSK
jgi:hypothetical protein